MIRVGTDIIEIHRMELAMQRESFLRRVYLPSMNETMPGDGTNKRRPPLRVSSLPKKPA